MSELRAEDLYHRDNRELIALMERGHRIDPAELDDTCYRGVSLGLPELVERATWKKFMKTFHRDRVSGALRGWNVRVEQDALDRDCTPLRKDGRPFTFGHYEVVRPTGYRMPRPVYNGLLIDYGRGGNAPLEPLNRARDPIVAVNEGSTALLLGWTYLDLGLRTVYTPSFFTLELLGPLDHFAAPR